jgi:spermidine synthase
MLRQVFGSTSFALSTLLAAFMSGMALGSYLSGRYADRLKRPLRTYGLLEGGIGLYAFLVPMALDVLPTVYDYFFDHFLNDFYLFSLLRFAAAFAILLVPTTLMGATLPIVSQWVSRRERIFQGEIGMLYGVNTFGACVGTLLAGFALLPNLGLSVTNTSFALVNLVLCAIVVGTDSVVTDTYEPDDALDDVDVESEDDEADFDEDVASVTGITETSDSIPEWLAHVVLGTFALTGAISMSYQVLWTRAYVIVLGSSTYSFTLILAAFLVGLSGGSAILSPFVKRIRRPVFWIAVVQLGVAATATGAFVVLDDLPSWLYYYFRGEIASAASVYLYYFFLVGIVVLVPTLLQGMTFPLVVRAVVHDRGESGEQVGRAYAFNTAGSIVGSFAAGFVLLITLGLQQSMVAVVGLNLAMAVVLGGLELREHWSRRRVAGFAAASLVAVAAFAMAPTLDRTDLTRGMFRVYWARELFESPESFHEDDPELLYYEDGLTATVTVEKRGDLHTLKANGKPEASDGGDMSTQILVGILPYVVRSGYDDVAIGDENSVMVGYGSGVTAGAALQWPLDHLEVVEIEPAMVEASTYFNHVNHKPLQDDRMEIVESDGRNYLEFTDQQYDVIVSEPSNPWIAGVSALFTVDHFEHVKSHLADDGIFAQWVQLYEMRPKNVRRIVATFVEVFPHVQAFTSHPKGSDLILVAGKRPIPLPPEGYRRAWDVESVRKELKRAEIDHLHDIYGLGFMNEAKLKSFAEGARLNTDDNGLLEFSAPLGLISYTEGKEFFIDNYFERPIYGDFRPYLAGWPDAPRWTSELVGKWVRAQWQGGKPALAEAMAEEAGFGTIDSLPEAIAPPLDLLERFHLVRHARSLELDKAALQTWPKPRSTYHEMLVDTEAGDKHAQAIDYLHAERQPEPDGYSGERGLYYAYLLYDQEYYHDAGLQLDRLEREDDDVIVESLPYLLLRAAVAFKRQNYDTSWDLYLEAGTKLLGTGPRERVNAPHRVGGSE